MLFYEIGLLPKIVFKEMFLMANQVHSYITRNSNNFYIISCPNKCKTFWYMISGSKMFQFTKCCYFFVERAPRYVAWAPNFLF